MKYRSLGDRKISVFGALLVITIIGSSATLVIVKQIQTINFAYVAPAGQQ